MPISFRKLGNLGRFGNQIFQYIAIRSAASRLQAKFYVPNWIGDEVFDLRDGSIRLSTDPGLSTKYAKAEDCGWDPRWEFQDGYDYEGYFVSEKFFESREAVRTWLRFRQPFADQTLNKYPSSHFSRKTALHMRLEDHLTLVNYYNPSPSYYMRAVELLGVDPKEIVVFSDEPSLARKSLGGRFKHSEYISGNTAAADMFLISQCESAIVAASTFSWWGAFLGGGRVVCPEEGILRPGAPLIASEVWPEDWTRMPAGLRWYDHAYWHRLRLGARKVYTLPAKALKKAGRAFRSKVSYDK